MRVLFPLLLCLSITGRAQQEFQYINKAYNNRIKTVYVYPRGGQNKPAVAALGRQNLILEFDDISENRQYYYVKLVSCTAEWEKSRLSNLDFLTQYNEFPINEYQYATTRSLGYVHYKFEIPAVKIPGNYLLVVYRSASDIVLSHRMMVYEEKAMIRMNNRWTGMGAINQKRQPLNFAVQYPDLGIFNPTQAIKIVIRQNHRWDNCIANQKPTHVNTATRELTYTQIRPEEAFLAGNEFRFVDFRSLQFPGQNTGRIDLSRKPYWLQVMPEKPRQGLGYLRYPDINGQCIIDNSDQPNPTVSGEYLYVTFTLNMHHVQKNIFLLGSYNNWQKNDENRLSYDNETGSYSTVLLLKQGFYNYMYWAEDNTNGFTLEGSHFETENMYEIFVYYRLFHLQTDLLIGYRFFALNQR